MLFLTITDAIGIGPAWPALTSPSPPFCNSVLSFLAKIKFCGLKYWMNLTKNKFIDIGWIYLLLCLVKCVTICVYLVYLFTWYMIRSKNLYKLICSYWLLDWIAVVFGCLDILSSCSVRHSLAKSKEIAAILVGLREMIIKKWFVRVKLNSYMLNFNQR